MTPKMRPWGQWMTRAGDLPVVWRRADLLSLCTNHVTKRGGRPQIQAISPIFSEIGFLACERSSGRRTMWIAISAGCAMGAGPCGPDGMIRWNDPHVPGLKSKAFHLPVPRPVMPPGPTSPKAPRAPLLAARTVVRSCLVRRADVDADKTGRVCTGAKAAPPCHPPLHRRAICRRIRAAG